MPQSRKDRLGLFGVLVLTFFLFGSITGCSNKSNSGKSKAPQPQEGKKTKAAAKSGETLDTRIGKSSFAQLAEAAARPNVVFVAVDDLNVNVGCYGAHYVKTPHLDALVARGIRFDRAYANYPTCNGSRTSMLSGRYPESTGVLLNSTDPSKKLPDAIFLPEYFKQHGYFTAALGKITHGRFAHALRCDEIVDEQKVTQRSILRKTLPFAWATTDNSDADEPDGSIARQAVRLLEQHHTERFFIAVGFHRPHVPHAAPKKYFDLYPPAAMKLHDRGGADQTPVAARNKFYPKLSRANQQQIISNYSAATSFMDAQLGVVLGALDRPGLTENTIVVFWSDHGWHLGDHGGMWAKGTLMESSARIPLIIAAPGKAIGACGRVVESVDLYPTLAALCGLGAPDRHGLWPVPVGRGERQTHLVHGTFRRVAR